MRRLILSVILLFLLCTCVACNKEKINNVDTIKLDALTENADEAQNYWLYYAKPFAKAPGGYYYVNQQLLMFFDEEEKESYPICNNINCQHGERDKSCGANISPIGGSTTERYMKKVFYYKDNLYLINTAGDLVRFSTDGSDRQVLVRSICTIDDVTGGTGQMLVFYEDCFYTYNVNQHLGLEGEYTEYITKYELSTGKKLGDVASFTGVGGAIVNVRVYGHQLFYTTTQMYMADKDKRLPGWSYSGLYVYNMKTGESSKVIDAQVQDYVGIPQDNKIVYFVDDKGYYSYSVESGKSTFIKAPDEENKMVILSYDGNYVYEDNYNWAVASDRYGLDIARRVMVYDRDMKEVRELDKDITSGLFYFGDENYMFSSSDRKSSANYAYVDKREDVQKWEFRYLYD